MHPALAGGTPSPRGPYSVGGSPGWASSSALVGWPSPERLEKRDGVAGSQVTKLGGDWSGMGFSKDQLYATTCLKTWDGMVQTMATLYTAWSKPCLY